MRTDSVSRKRSMSVKRRDGSGSARRGSSERGRGREESTEFVRLHELRRE